MHNAPAVSFPVGRSRFQAWFLGAAWLAGASVCAYWGSVMGSLGWRHGLALAMPLGAGVAAWAVWAGWQRQGGGTLRWDGLCWWLEVPAAISAVASVSAPAAAPALKSPASLTGDLAVHLDFQNFLLLSLRFENGGMRWLWLDQSVDPTLWQALRRAVHS